MIQRQGFDQRMDMGGHDDGGMDQQAVAVETQQAIGNDHSCIQTGQRPRTQTGIQPSVVPLAEPAVIFLPLTIFPRFGVELTPEGKFRFPGAQLLLGNGVRQPETDPIDGPVQVPMRQATASDLKLRIVCG